MQRNSLKMDYTINEYLTTIPFVWQALNKIGFFAAAAGAVVVVSFLSLFFCIVGVHFMGILIVSGHGADAVCESERFTVYLSEQPSSHRESMSGTFM